MTKQLHVLNLANKQLPDHDYRVQYRSLSQLARLTYGLPDKPDSLDADEFVKLGFREGLGIADLMHFWGLGKHLVKNRKYDLVHCFSTKLQLLGPLVAKIAGVSSVSTITGFGRTFNRDELRYRLLRPFYMALLRRSVASAKAVFFQNHGDLQWLERQLPKQAHKMHWIGSGVEAEVITGKNFEVSRLVVLMVARLMHDKGIQEYLEAASRLAGDQYRFLLVGPPSVGQESLYRQVQLAHERGVVEYLGEMNQQELCEQYRRSHIFAFPSHGEGMPRVMLEAGHGLLCPVASDIPAHRDLIKPGAGFLIERKQDFESLVARLRDLQADRTLLKQNACAYQQHILTNYTMTAYAKRMDGFLQQLCPERLPTPPGRAAQFSANEAA